MAGVSLLRPQHRAFNEPLFLTLPAKCPTNRMGLSGIQEIKMGRRYLGAEARVSVAPGQKQA